MMPAHRFGVMAQARKSQGRVVYARWRNGIQTEPGQGGVPSGAAQLGCWARLPDRELIQIECCYLLERLSL
jgi:hypothetical protein